MDKKIVRMTIVYSDGSMAILVMNKDGHLVEEHRRVKWWIVQSVKNKLITIILEDTVCALIVFTT